MNKLGERPHLLKGLLKPFRDNSEDLPNVVSLGFILGFVKIFFKNKQTKRSTSFKEKFENYWKKTCHFKTSSTVSGVPVLQYFFCSFPRTILNENLLRNTSKISWNLVTELNEFEEKLALYCEAKKVKDLHCEIQNLKYKLLSLKSTMAWMWVDMASIMVPWHTYVTN